MIMHESVDQADQGLCEPNQCYNLLLNACKFPTSHQVLQVNTIIIMVNNVFKTEDMR